MSALLEVKTALEHLRTVEDEISILNNKLKPLKKKSAELETQAINLIAKSGYKGRPMRLGKFRYTVIDKRTRDGFSQQVVRAGLERYLQSKHLPSSEVDTIMTVINAQRKETSKPTLLAESV